MRHLTMALGALLGARSRVAGLLLGAGGGYVLGLLLEARPKPGGGRPSLARREQEPAPEVPRNRYPEEEIVDALRGEG